jgi:hypothetical protein
VRFGVVRAMPLSSRGVDPLRHACRTALLRAVEHLQPDVIIIDTASPGDGVPRAPRPMRPAPVAGAGRRAVALGAGRRIHIYVCGDAQRMAKDVDDALKAVVAEQGAMSTDQAAAFVAGLAQAGRYGGDVY